MLTVLKIREKIWLHILISAFTLVGAFIIAFLLGYLIAAIVLGDENSILVNLVAVLVMNGIYGMVIKITSFGVIFGLALGLYGLKNVGVDYECHLCNNSGCVIYGKDAICFFGVLCASIGLVFDIVFMFM